MTKGPAEKRLELLAEYEMRMVDDMNLRSSLVETFSRSLERFADRFADVADDLGLEGETADALEADLRRQATRTMENSGTFYSATGALGEGHVAIVNAVTCFENLPEATVSEAERLVAISTGAALGIGGALIANELIDRKVEELEELRERDAKRAFGVFERAVGKPATRFRRIAEQLEAPSPRVIDPITLPPPAAEGGSEGGGKGRQITSELPGWTPPPRPPIDLPEPPPPDLALPEPELSSPGSYDPSLPPGAGQEAPAPDMDWALSPEEYQRKRAAADGSVGGVIDYGQPGGPGGAGGGAGTGGLSGNAGLGVAGIGAAGAVGAGAASVAGLGRGGPGGGQGGPGVIGPGGPGGTGIGGAGGGSGTGSGSSSGAGVGSRSGGLSGAGGPGDVSSGQGGVRGVDGRMIHGGQVGVGGMSESERRARRLARHGVFAEREEEDEARRKKEEEEARAARKPVDPDAWCVVPSLADLEESARQEAKYQREKATTADGWIRPCDLLIRLADRINTQTQLAAEATNTAELARFAAETAQADKGTDPESLTKLVEKARTTASASLAANQALDATYADLDRARAADEKFRTDNIRFRETVHKKQYKYWLKDQAEKARINALFRNRLRRLLHIDPPLVQEQFIPREIPDYLIK